MMFLLAATWRRVCGGGVVVVVVPPPPQASMRERSTIVAAQSKAGVFVDMRHPVSPWKTSVERDDCIIQLAVIPGTNVLHDLETRSAIESG